MIALVPRPEASRVMVYLSPVIALVATVLSGLILFTFMNYNFVGGTFIGNPLDPLVNFFYTPLTGRNGLTNLALKATAIAIDCGNNTQIIARIFELLQMPIHPLIELKLGQIVEKRKHIFNRSWSRPIPPFRNIELPSIRRFNLFDERPVQENPRSSKEIVKASEISAFSNF